MSPIFLVFVDFDSIWAYSYENIKTSYLETQVGDMSDVSWGEPAYL